MALRVATERGINRRQLNQQGNENEAHSSRTQGIPSFHPACHVRCDHVHAEAAGSKAPGFRTLDIPLSSLRSHAVCCPLRNARQIWLNGVCVFPLRGSSLSLSPRVQGLWLHSQICACTMLAKHVQTLRLAHSSSRNKGPPSPGSTNAPLEWASRNTTEHGVCVDAPQPQN